MDVSNSTEELLKVADEVQQECFWHSVLDDAKYPKVLEEERLIRVLEEEKEDMGLIQLNDYVKSNCGITGNRRIRVPVSEDNKFADDDLAKWLQCPLELEMLDSGYSQARFSKAPPTMPRVNNVSEVSEDTMDKKTSLGLRKYTVDNKNSDSRSSMKLHRSKNESAGVDRFSHCNCYEGQDKSLHGKQGGYGELALEDNFTDFSSNGSSTFSFKEVEGRDVQASLPGLHLTHTALLEEEAWLSDQGLLPFTKIKENRIDMSSCKNAMDTQKQADKTHLSLGPVSPSGSAPFSYLLCSERIENSLNFYGKADADSISKDMPLDSSMTDLVGCPNADILSLSDHQSANSVEHVQFSQGGRVPQSHSGWIKGCQKAEITCLNDHQNLVNCKHVVDYIQSSDGRSIAEDLLIPITPTKSRKDNVTSTKDDGASSGGSDTSDSFKETFSSSKRKKEHFEWQSEDVEAESALNSQTRNSASKRARTNEVHNLSERRRRTRINDKMNALRELIPNASKSNKAALLDEAIEYLKSLQLQLQVLAMRAGIAPMMPSTSVLPPQLQPMVIGMNEGLIPRVMPDPGIALCDMSYGVPARRLVPALTELNAEVRTLQFVDNNYVAQHRLQQQQLQIYQQQLIKHHHNQQQQVLQQLQTQSVYPLSRQL